MLHYYIIFILNIKNYWENCVSFLFDVIRKILDIYETYVIPAELIYNFLNSDQQLIH